MGFLSLLFPQQKNAAAFLKNTAVGMWNAIKNVGTTAAKIGTTVGNWAGSNPALNKPGQWIGEKLGITKENAPALKQELEKKNIFTRSDTGVGSFSSPEQAAGMIGESALTLASPFTGGASSLLGQLAVGGLIGGGYGLTESMAQEKNLKDTLTGTAIGTILGTSTAGVFALGNYLVNKAALASQTPAQVTTEKYYGVPKKTLEKEAIDRAWEAGRVSTGQIDAEDVSAAAKMVSNRLAKYGYMDPDPAVNAAKATTSIIKNGQALDTYVEEQIITNVSRQDLVDSIVARVQDEIPLTETELSWVNKYVNRVVPSVPELSGKAVLEASRTAGKNLSDFEPGNTVQQNTKFFTWTTLKDTLNSLAPEGSPIPALNEAMHTGYEALALNTKLEAAQRSATGRLEKAVASGTLKTTTGTGLLLKVGDILFSPLIKLGSAASDASKLSAAQMILNNQTSSVTSPFSVLFRMAQNLVTAGVTRAAIAPEVQPEKKTVDMSTMKKKTVNDLTTPKKVTPRPKGNYKIKTPAQLKAAMQ